MPVQYVNRKGKAHYLRTVKAKKGGTRYYIVKNPEKYSPSELLENLPEGFEFHEHPGDAQVVLRKVLQTNILSEERKIIEIVMQNHETAKDYLIDTEANALVVYLAHLTQDEFDYLSEDQFKQVQSYNDKLRFEKSGSNTYMAQRFCNLSRYYGWITLETSTDLKYLAEKYCYHIDKESLLDFWIEGEEDW